jgi:hypothetical protein
MALARCWEGHVNSQMLLGALGDERQKDRWFHGIVERGDIRAAWSGEPQARITGQAARFGTVVREVRGGHLIDGTKVFATSARGALGDPAGEPPRAGQCLTPVSRRSRICSPVVSPHPHSSREVTHELVAQAERIFCMPEDQCRSVVGRFPEAAPKVRRLDPDGDLEDPSGQDPGVFLSLGARGQSLVRHRISEMVPT